MIKGRKTGDGVKLSKSNKPYFIRAPSLAGDEEIIGTVQASREFTESEIKEMSSQYTKYGTSAWKKMVEDWRKEHPQIKKELSSEEQIKLDDDIEKANQEWRRIQELKSQENQSNTERIKQQWLLADNKKIARIDKLKRKQARKKRR